MESDRKTDSKDAEAFAALIEDIARTPWQTLPMPEPVPVDPAPNSEKYAAALEEVRVAIDRHLRLVGIDPSQFEFTGYANTIRELASQHFKTIEKERNLRGAIYSAATRCHIQRADSNAHKTINDIADELEDFREKTIKLTGQLTEEINRAEHDRTALKTLASLFVVDLSAGQPIWHAELINRAKLFKKAAYANTCTITTLKEIFHITGQPDDDLDAAIIARAKELQRAYSDQRTTATASTNAPLILAKQELEGAKELYPYEAFRTSGIMNVPQSSRHRLAGLLNLKYREQKNGTEIMRELGINGTTFAALARVAERVLEQAEAFNIPADVLTILCAEYGTIADQETGVKSRAPIL